VIRASRPGGGTTGSGRHEVRRDRNKQHSSDRAGALFCAAWRAAAVRCCRRHRCRDGQFFTAIRRASPATLLGSPRR
jgi:hypothetical protein